MPPTTIRRQDPAFHHPFNKVYADWLGAPLRAHCHDHLSHEFSLQLVNHCLIPGSYQMDAIASVRTRSHAERRFSMFRFKRYDEALLADTSPALDGNSSSPCPSESQTELRWRCCW